MRKVPGVELVLKDYGPKAVVRMFNTLSTLKILSANIFLCRNMFPNKTRFYERKQSWLKNLFS